MYFFPWCKLDQLYCSTAIRFCKKNCIISSRRQKNNQKILLGSCVQNAQTRPICQFSMLPSICMPYLRAGNIKVFPEGIRKLWTSSQLQCVGTMKTKSQTNSVASVISVADLWRMSSLKLQICQMKDVSTSLKVAVLQGYMRRAFVASFPNNKGQVVLRWIILNIGRAYFLHKNFSALAEDFHASFTFSHPNESSAVLVLNHTDNNKASVIGQTVETLMLIFRAMYLLVLFTPAFVLAIYADKPSSHIRAIWLGVLLRTLEHAGPAFIKWGQWAATRPDIFSPDLCRELSKLHSQAPAHSFAKTKEIVESAFRMPLYDIFEEFSEEPVASGSIAQVHKAVLRDQGTSKKVPLVVAVKVRHPNVEKVIERDFSIINGIAKLSTLVPGLQHLQLDRTVQQFATFMTKQVDLTLEAAHLMRFLYNFRKWKNVSFPRPIYPFVHPAVLIETFEQGFSIADIVDQGPRTRSHAQLAHLGASILLKMLLMDNFIHADLHPGNIFVRFQHRVPKLILLDVGMTAELSQRNRFILMDLFKGIAERDGAKVARCTLEFSEDQSCSDSEAFIRDVDVTFKEYFQVRGTAKMGEHISALFDAVRRHQVNLDGEVCTVMVTVLILEGWQRKLDISLDIIDMINSLLSKAESLASYEYTMAAIAAP
ncbi:hypothetical protein O6H91_22G009700 [Diphasiastrum complanatum]|uniref:Uncharacterized protein n=7 Tax=Diphasiastrum complanatum TaxID=34168 RepID=A0ACC2ACM1_DIPCM|nr:hypothetical protein O6H91_22G009700 [Diphasiastrum complanatum]KAJ7515294.1 hypothetical protein O6H91_22G009700 [Diphasiastrum complanatum]KAJ7515295.1 hypothetical protein O6H91_22G009700 [Diphasiastrum complanatum]KAJ7515296.1 hypothetical protein O6H91_22G009700 [Diphasiastrum complanatum]KAJ7515298.1 hypothetical protein O6H91_22G009700 [Diphasiastrum complanatum]